MLSNGRPWHQVFVAYSCAVPVVRLRREPHHSNHCGSLRRCPAKPQQLHGMRPSASQKYPDPLPDCSNAALTKSAPPEVVLLAKSPFLQLHGRQLQKLPGLCIEIQIQGCLSLGSAMHVHYGRYYSLCLHGALMRLPTPAVSVGGYNVDLAPWLLVLRGQAIPFF